jgi:hypothetical protein
MKHSIPTRFVALAAVLIGFTDFSWAQTTVYVLANDGTTLRTVPTSNPAAASAPISISGINAGETLVSIDVRPQNQQLYALGVNATANTATLYCLSPQSGTAAAVGTAAGIALVDAGGNPVDFADPATVGWDIDFNPAVDRLRVVAGSLTFRVNPNTGASVDGDLGGATGSVAGVNPDGTVNGGTTTVSGAAYTNNLPNNGSITTLYTLDSASDSLFIQNPPNAGSQTSGLFLTLGGSPLDFSGATGFDIVPGVDVASSNTTVTSGSGFALLTVGGTTGLYSINLVNGTTSSVGAVSGRSMAVRTEIGAAIALSANGANLVRFGTATPGTTTTVAVGSGSLSLGETIVGIDFRPQTGQFYALAVNHTANTGTLYLLDPQTGSLTVVGAQNSISNVALDFPDPATAGYGMDFNPTVDRLRVVASTGLNFRINPITGQLVAADSAINGLPSGSTGVSAAAYTNSFAQSLSGGATTQYTLDGASNSIFIQNPPNSGTQTSQLSVTTRGNPLDFTDINGFDIPSSVRVSASGSAATGSGWLVATVAGNTGLYQLDLSTGVATDIGNIGAGATPLSGLSVFTTPAAIVRNSVNAILADGADTIDFGVVNLPSEILGNGIDDNFNGQVDEAEYVAFKTITLANDGSQPLSYSTSTTSSVFRVTANSSGTVAPGGSVEIQVGLSPDAAMPFAATLTITTNDPANDAFEIALKAEAFLAAAADAAVVTTGETRLYPLANDGATSGFLITSVSDPEIIISPNGRMLIIPASFAGGSFTYTSSDGAQNAQATVTVTFGTQVTAPVAYSGLLFTGNGDIIGSANVALSSKGIATVQLLGGAGKTGTKIAVPTIPSNGANFTSFGYTQLARKADGTLDVAIFALGGEIRGTLLPVQKTATVAKHHIALAGGGYAIANVSAKGGVKLTGLLPDGVPFTGASALRDNNTFAFHTAVKGPKPPSTAAGELTVADLARTDVSGTLKWAKLPQLPGVKGLYLAGTTEVLTANGCLYSGSAPLPSGTGTLRLVGGNLSADETNSVTISTGGIPAPAAVSALKTWTGVKPKLGKFSATIAIPGIPKPVKGSGLYLPKSNSAWGFFPGKTIGGSIELKVP